jgi:PAS domain S-box-containing protein
MGQDQRYHDLIEAVTDYAIFFLDPDGQVGTWNAGAQRITGYTQEEILGEHLRRLYPPDPGRPGAPERALQIARERGRFAEEVRLVRKDGSRFSADVVIAPQHDRAGDLVGYATVARDVSDISRAQDQLALVSDRERIARELHAGTIKLLYGIGLHLQAIAGRSTDPEISAELQSCIKDQDRAISELRRYVFGLDPASGSRAEEQR